jgi:hypothetical protein
MKRQEEKKKENSFGEFYKTQKKGCRKSDSLHF